MQPMPHLKSVIAPLISLICLGALIAADSAPKSPPELPAELKEYRSWKKLLDKPRSVSLSLSGLCATIAQQQADEARKKNGPHAQRFIQLYLNQQAAEGMKGTGEHRYPVGSVIVKEKMASSNGTAPDGIGVMIKREGKEFKASGGWEFRFYPEAGDAKKTHEACAACHHGASGKDYVMGDYPGQADKVAQAVGASSRSDH